MTPVTKRLAIALAISIGVNLLFAGFYLGLRVQRSKQPPPHASVGARMHGVDRAGPRAHPGPSRRTFGDRHPELKEHRQKTAAARGAVRAALEQEPFDKALLERALEGLRKETSESQTLAHRALVETAARADTQARRQMATEFEFRGKGKRRDDVAPR
jgi:uncharacterized membrane protein